MRAITGAVYNDISLTSDAITELEMDIKWSLLQEIGILGLCEDLSFDMESSQATF